MMRANVFLSTELVPDIALSQCSLIEQMNDYDVLRANICSHDICITRYIWEDIYKRWWRQ